MTNKNIFFLRTIIGKETILSYFYPKRRSEDEAVP